MDSRVIFGDEVTPGMTLLIPCRATRACRYPGAHDVGVEHPATVLRMRTPELVGPSAVLVADDGTQHGWEAGRDEPVRVQVEPAGQPA